MTIFLSPLTYIHIILGVPRTGNSININVFFGGGEGDNVAGT